MRVRGEFLQTMLQPGLPVELRDSNYHLADSDLAFVEAFAMAVRGEVEGVATSTGRVKYLRVLPAAERNVESLYRRAIPESESQTGGCRMPSNLRMGVYREKVVKQTASCVLDGRGIPVVETQVIGHVYQHYGARL